jgi:hypothetical protein
MIYEGWSINNRSGNGIADSICSMPSKTVPSLGRLVHSVTFDPW